MSYIKTFIDKVSALDSRPGKDLILPAHEAKMLRDEIAKLLVDRVAASNNMKSQPQQTIISGGGFK